MLVLGIESSCDDTAAAIIQDHADISQRIRANIVYSQMDHKVHGGVVPEIAARAHLDKIDIVIKQAMAEAGVTYAQLDGVAATCGPGLIGGVMVGMMAGKAIALAHDKPFIAVNHLEGHALTARLSDDLAFPYMMLLVSGGHTQILIAHDVGRYECLGTTLDDAAGECFDKCAKMMGLPFPGGPNLEKLARECTDQAAALARFTLPRPMKGRKNYDFSFSGLKTAVRTYIEDIAAQSIAAQNAPSNAPSLELPRGDMAGLAHSFQTAVQDVIKDRVNRALKDHPTLKTLVVCGGVAANSAVREALIDLTNAHNVTFIAPPLKLCTDNGAMIGWTGLERLKRGEKSDFACAARPRWPLSELEEVK